MTKVNDRILERARGLMAEWGRDGIDTVTLARALVEATDRERASCLAICNQIMAENRDCGTELDLHIALGAATCADEIKKRYAD